MWFRIQTITFDLTSSWALHCAPADSRHLLSITHDANVSLRGFFGGVCMLTDGETIDWRFSQIGQSNELMGTCVSYRDGSLS